MTESTWKLLTTFTDHPSAQLLADGLSSEGIPVRLSSEAIILGQAVPTRVYVEAANLRRAQWLTSQHALTDEELADLAMSAAPEKDA